MSLRETLAKRACSMPRYKKIKNKKNSLKETQTAEENLKFKEMLSKNNLKELHDENLELNGIAN